MEPSRNKAIWVPFEKEEQAPTRLLYNTRARARAQAKPVPESLLKKSGQRERSGTYAASKSPRRRSCIRKTGIKSIFQYSSCQIWGPQAALKVAVFVDCPDFLKSYLPEPELLDLTPFSGTNDGRNL